MIVKINDLKFNKFKNTKLNEQSYKDHFNNFLNAAKNKQNSKLSLKINSDFEILNKNGFILYNILKQIGILEFPAEIIDKHNLSTDFYNSQNELHNEISNYTNILNNQQEQNLKYTLYNYKPKSNNIYNNHYFVTGKFLSNNSTFQWKINNLYFNYLNLKIGDLIICESNNGFSMVEITNISNKKKDITSNYYLKNVIGKIKNINDNLYDNVTFALKQLNSFQLSLKEN